MTRTAIFVLLAVVLLAAQAKAPLILGVTYEGESHKPTFFPWTEVIWQADGTSNYRVFRRVKGGKYQAIATMPLKVEPS